MRVRKKGSKKFPAKGTPEYFRLSPRDKANANLKPFQKGNKLSVGRKPGSISIVQHLKKRLSGPALDESKGYENLSDELAAILAESARDGSIGFMNAILDRVESPNITQEEANAMIDRFYEIVERYVKDRPTLGKIAKAIANLKSEK